MWPRSLETRTIGVGDISLARSAARGVDSAELTRTVHAALETGIDHLEVAPEDDSEKLVGNALRHGQATRGGRVLVGWQFDDSGLRIEVTDGGSGKQPKPKAQAKPVRVSAPKEKETVR